MTALRRPCISRLVVAGLLVAAGMVLGACSDSRPPGFQGYVEGKFVNVAAAFAGRLDRLSVARGDEVAMGAPLYALDAVNEAAAKREAQEQKKSAEAHLADLTQGRRLPEQDVTRAQLAQAQVEMNRSAVQLARDEAQFRAGGIARERLDDTRATHEANQARVAQLQSELAVAQLPSRGEQIKAQAALVAAAGAAVEQAAWKLEQKSVQATRSGRIVDTLFREGDWVPAGTAVVRMLPPQNVVVRLFVPQAVVGSLTLGRAVVIECEGCGPAIPGTLNYIATEAEFTPPIIFSNETRSKLVFMVEAQPEIASAQRLHPGQPVNVLLP